MKERAPATPSGRTELVSRPTRDQVERFRALSVDERYRWYVGLLKTTHGLASPEARARWQAAKRAQSGGFLSVASAFARALAAADFEDAAGWLAEDCHCVTAGGVLEGARSIIAWYAAAHAPATAALERIRYRFGVEPTAPGVAIVTVEKRVAHGADEPRDRRRYEVHVGRSKRVERIVHLDQEG